MKLISHCLTPINRLFGIQSLIGVGTLSGPRPFSALPPIICYEASPKAISGRTSYLRVRLEFHRYTQVIRHHCNGGRFGPPWGFTPTSTCSCVGHPVSGLWQRTSCALFRLALATPPVLNTLSLLVTITRRTVLQKVPHHTLTCFECL